MPNAIHDSSLSPARYGYSAPRSEGEHSNSISPDASPRSGERRPAFPVPTNGPDGNLSQQHGKQTCPAVPRGDRQWIGNDGCASVPAPWVRRFSARPAKPIQSTA